MDVTAKQTDLPAVAYPDRWDRHVAYWVSQLLSPPVLGLGGALLVGAVIGTVPGWLWVGVFLLLGAIVPTLYVLYLLQTGEVSDFHLNKREERTKPTLAALLGTTAAAIVIGLGNGPALLLALAIAAVIQNVIFFVITLWWKVSAHSAAAAAVGTLSWAVYGVAAWPVMLCVPLVLWARIRLKRHTPAQTVVGAALGFAILLVALIWVGFV